MKKVLMLGSNGFIGSKLKKYLKNYKLLTPSKDECNIFNNVNLEKYIRGNDLVINCTLGRDKDNFNVNEEGVQNIIDVCIKANIPLIQLSSTSIEDFPNKDYSKYKLITEKIFLNSKVKGRLIRLPHIYVNHLRTLKYLFYIQGRPPMHINKVCKWLEQVIRDVIDEQFLEVKQ